MPVADETQQISEQQQQQQQHEEAPPVRSLSKEGRGGQEEEEDQHDDAVVEGQGEEEEQQQQLQHQEQQNQLLFLEGLIQNNFVFGPDAPGRMIVLEDEREWALDIKKAIEDNNELDNLTDYWYASLALIELDDIEAAVRRVEVLQAIKQEYGIIDNFQEARRALREYTTLFPGWYIHFMHNQQAGGMTVVVDITKLSMNTIKRHPRGEELVIKACYYCHQMLTPDFEALRHGATVLAECQGFNHGEGINLGMFRKIWDINSNAPQQFQRVCHYHTGVIFNVLMSMGKQFMPPDLRSKIEIACVSEARLDELFWLPNPQVGQARTLQRLEDALERRYRNEAEFSL